MNKKLLVHEQTYKKNNLVSLIHKNRLKVIHEVFKKYVTESEITWADFGCSNGFIPEELVRTNEFKFSKIFGYDHVEELLKLARAKQIPNAEFKYFDMNAVSNIEEQFDLVTCFETLEHVGNLENALINLINHLGRKGIMIISVPNETGLIGLVKFLGRLSIRRNPYNDFFTEQSHFKYMISLLKNDFIDDFRKPNQLGYGPHLGFDYRKFEDFINEIIIKNKQLELIEKSFASKKMSVTYVLRKL